MLREVISLLPKNCSVKIYRAGSPILNDGEVFDTKEFAKLFADVEVKEIRAIHFDDFGIVYLIEII